MHRRRTRGLTLLEAVIAVVVLSVIAVAAASGLQSVARGPAQLERRLAVYNLLVDKMEQLRATDPTTLTNGSDPAPGVALDGGSTRITRTWTVSNYNVDGSNPSDCRQITVNADGQSLTTVVTAP